MDVRFTSSFARLGYDERCILVHPFGGETAFGAKASLARLFKIGPGPRMKISVDIFVQNGLMPPKATSSFLTERAGDMTLPVITVFVSKLTLSPL